MSHLYDARYPNHCRFCLRTAAILAQYQTPKDPKRDRELTDAFHWMMWQLKSPRRPIDGPSRWGGWLLRPSKKPPMLTDWTVDVNGRSNSSEAYKRVVHDVVRLLRDVRVGDDVDRAARVIVSRLAHVHRLAPPTDDDREEVG